MEARSRARLKRWLHTHGVPFIDPPLGSVTEEGFLRPEYNAPDLPDGRRDPHHANQAYGALMMRQVLNFLEKPGAVRPPPLRIERYGEMA